MKKVFQILKWSVIIALMVVILAFANSKQTQQLATLNSINIEQSEDKFVTHKVVLDYIEKQNFKFDSVGLSNISLDELENVLKQHPAIKDVEVYGNQEGVLDVSLKQRKAVVRIKTDFSDFYLDEDGLEMPLSKEYTPRVPVVTGDVLPKDYSRISSFIAYINGFEFWKSQIVQLHFDNNEVIIIPRVGAQKIQFGALENINEKLDNLYQFYKQAMPVKGWQTYSEISLKYNNQIVCTKK